MKKVLSALMLLVVTICILVGCHDDNPPIPKVTSNETQIPVKQSSYCWTYKCVDYSGGKEMLEGVRPTVVEAGSKIKVTFQHQPLPTTFIFQQLLKDHDVEVPFSDGYLLTPLEQGVYYYRFFAKWSDGVHSKGDTSGLFVIEVK